MPENSPIIQVRNLEKTYRTARGSLSLFQGLDLEVNAGELVAIVGQSGAGKSTLLHILGALDAPTAGTVHCASTNVARSDASGGSSLSQSRDRLRVAVSLFVPEFSALENVAMPLLGARASRKRKPWQWHLIG